MNHKCIKADEDDEYTYRSIRIRLNMAVAKGYYGRYSIGGYRNGKGFETLTQAKKYIDDARITPTPNKKEEQS